MSCTNCDTSGDTSFIRNRTLMKSINITPLQINNEVNNFISNFISTFNVSSIINNTVSIIANNSFIINGLTCQSLNINNITQQNLINNTTDITIDTNISTDIESNIIGQINSILKTNKPSSNYLGNILQQGYKTLSNYYSSDVLIQLNDLETIIKCIINTEYNRLVGNYIFFDSCIPLNTPKSSVVKVLPTTTTKTNLKSNFNYSTDNDIFYNTVGIPSILLNDSSINTLPGINMTIVNTILTSVINSLTNILSTNMLSLISINCNTASVSNINQLNNIINSFNASIKTSFTGDQPSSLTSTVGYFFSKCYSSLELEYKIKMTLFNSRKKTDLTKNEYNLYVTAFNARLDNLAAIELQVYYIFCYNNINIRCNMEQRFNQILNISYNPSTLCVVIPELSDMSSLNPFTSSNAFITSINTLLNLAPLYYIGGIVLIIMILSTILILM